MEEPGRNRMQFRRKLDPRAGEFRPRNSDHHQLRRSSFYGPSVCFYGSSVGGEAVPFSNGAVDFPYVTVLLPVTDYHVSPPVPMAPPVLHSSVIKPTRSLLLSLVPCESVSESSLRKELAAFGEVRGIQMERFYEGMVTIHFYDLRHAEMAVKEIQNNYLQNQTWLTSHYNHNAMATMSITETEIYRILQLGHPPPATRFVSGCIVWAQFVIPGKNVVPCGKNQGSIVVLNLDSKLSSEILRQIFEEYGPVKEIRSTPLKKNQSFIEYFDVRDAAKALAYMNGKEISGKSVVIKFSLPGGQTRRFLNISNAQKLSTHTSGVHHSRNPRNFTTPSSSTMSSLPRKFSCRLSNKAVGPRSSMSQSSRKSNVTEDCPKMKKGSLGFSEEDMNNVRSKQQELLQHQARRRPWKGKQIKQVDPCYLIKDDTIESERRDSRTTVMIKNIPNKYSQKSLLNLLDHHCIHCNEEIDEGDDKPLSSYDFVYLPIDFINKCNMGYGFVNMTSPEAAWKLYKAFHHQRWKVFNSRKICEVTYARVQGLEALKEHFKNSNLPCDMSHYLPVVFTPPRNGRLLTDPTPLGGQTHKEEQEQQQHHPNPMGQPASSVTDSHDTLPLVSDTTMKTAIRAQTAA